MFDCTQMTTQKSRSPKMPTAKMYQGKEVHDAKLPLKMSVRPHDIKSAKRKDPLACAIARCAIRDKHVISARIGQKFALIEYSSHFERYKVNHPASKAIREFDKSGTFIEGEYHLLPISPSSVLTGKTHSPRSPNEKPHSGGISTIKRKATRNIYKAKECI